MNNKEVSELLETLLGGEDAKKSPEFTAFLTALFGNADAKQCPCSEEQGHAKPMPDDLTSAIPMPKLNPCRVCGSEGRVYTRGSELIFVMCTDPNCGDHTRECPTVTEAANLWNLGVSLSESERCAIFDSGSAIQEEKEKEEEEEGGGFMDNLSGFIEQAPMLLKAGESAIEPVIVAIVNVVATALGNVAESSDLLKNLAACQMRYMTALVEAGFAREEALAIMLSNMNTLDKVVKSIK